MQDVTITKANRAEAKVDAFKSGVLSRTAITLELAALFAEPDSPTGTDSTPFVPPSGAELESLMEPYTDMCDQFTRDRAEAARRGKKRQHGDVEGSGDGANGAPAGDGGESDSEDVEPPAKRRLVAAFDEDELPWAKNDALLLPFETLRADLAETVRLLGRYAIDHKKTLRSILNRTCVAFPESQWLNLITNKPVNFDVILTSMYSVAPASAHTETIGDIDLTFNAAPGRVTRTVATQAEWTICWLRLSQATLVVFPHLSVQLDVYGHYILAKFVALHESQHHRVIDFEKACRFFASLRADIGLDQLHHFTHLETMHLNSLGRLAMESSLSRSEGRSDRRDPRDARDSRTGGSRLKSTAKSTEPCRLWNRNECKRSDDECRNLHICLDCRKNHRVADCPRK